MFFFGVFGVETKSKELRDINNITCKQCGRLAIYRLIKQYSLFHFFFLPLFKWGEKYFLVSRCCESVFRINDDKGRKLEQGMDFKVEDEDIQYLYEEQEHNQDICPYCRREIDRSFAFCPYCGKEIIEENRSISK